MERKHFLKKGVMVALGASTIIPLLSGCKKDDGTSSDGTGGTGGGGACTTSPTETAGPYPTKVPSSLVNADIRSDRTGVLLNIKLNINNKNNNCAALAGAIVDIWHCDKDGNYSEYSSFTSAHFLRGRQVTDANGLVSFTSIFPGWYPGRAPHIHVHVYSASGSSLLVTQIAFPTDVCNTVYTTATSFYTKGTQDTQNASDGIFADSLASELASVSGSVATGYSLTHLITVNG
jgi:protocatechuate 3,4-dioxygenase beta subunit